MADETIFTVSEINGLIKNIIEDQRILNNIQIQGEISNFKQYASGHCYFTLKDAGGVLKTVMFRSQLKNLRFSPQNGDTVLAIGRIGVYERDGVYQLYVDLLIPLGAGDLMQAYEKLKKQLTIEGIFAEENKKELPLNPQTIGIITSPSGAAVRDLITVSKRRNSGIKLLLLPVKVQGIGAAEEIAAAIRFMNQQRLAEVLIVGRGGGSIEDLWAFNEEIVVRAIASSKIPIVSAVGHETDFTLADFAADQRAATPSQAAELVVADLESIRRYILETEKRCKRLLLQKYNYANESLQRLSNSWVLKKPKRWLEEHEQRTDMAVRYLQEAMLKKVECHKHAFNILIARLEALSPLTVLSRGYSITKVANGKTIASIEEVRWGDEIITQIADGNVVSIVQQVEGREDNDSK